MMKKTTTVLAVLALALAVFSFNAYADSATGQVTINNIVPTVTGITLWNQAGADDDIGLQTGSTVVVMANATITDLDGGTDIDSATATLYHSTSTSGASDDENIHLTNSSCTLSAADGNTKVATCKFTMGFMALDGTWTVNITAEDAESHSASGADANDVDALIALDVTEATIDFGEMSPGTNSSTPANVTVVNLGNSVMDTQLSGTNYSCTTGEIPVGNTKYDVTEVDYDTMITELTEEAVPDEDFNLGVRGVATSNGETSAQKEYFGILTPSTGVGGACSNTVTIDVVL